MWRKQPPKQIKERSTSELGTGAVSNGLIYQVIRVSEGGRQAEKVFENIMAFFFF